MSRIDDELSRRALLRNAAAAVELASTSALVTGCAQPMAQAPPPPSAPPQRQTKAQAAYQDRPNGSERCGVCANFIPPGDCRVIQGPVNPDGWCRNFRSRA